MALVSLPFPSMPCPFPAFDVLAFSARFCLLQSKAKELGDDLPILPSFQTYLHSDHHCHFPPGKRGRGGLPLSKRSPAIFPLNNPLLCPQEQDLTIFPPSTWNFNFSLSAFTSHLINLSAALNSSDLIFNILSSFCFADFTRHCFPFYLPDSSSSIVFGTLHFLPGKSQPHHACGWWFLNPYIQS